MEFLGQQKIKKKSDTSLPARRNVSCENFKNKWTTARGLLATNFCVNTLNALLHQTPKIKTKLSGYSNYPPKKIWFKEYSQSDGMGHGSKETRSYTSAFWKCLRWKTGLHSHDRFNMSSNRLENRLRNKTVIGWPCYSCITHIQKHCSINKRSPTKLRL